MLSSEELRQELISGQAGGDAGIGVSPFPIYNGSKQLGPASLDVRLGRWFLSIQQSKRHLIDLSNFNPEADSKSLNGRYYYVPFGQKFIIHPGRFVLAATLEWISMPAYIGAYITGKSSLGRRGLIIETASGIQPRFNGCLTLELYNCGEIPLAITPGMRVAQIFFHRMGKPVSENDSSFNAHRKPLFGGYSLDHKLSEENANLFNSNGF